MDQCFAFLPGLVPKDLFSDFFRLELSYQMTVTDVYINGMAGYIYKMGALAFGGWKGIFRQTMKIYLVVYY
jgi:hypothetical protein